MDNIYLSKDFEEVGTDDYMQYIIANDLNTLFKSFNDRFISTEGLKGKGIYEWDCLHMMWSEVIPGDTVYSKLSRIAKNAQINVHEITIKVRYDGENIIPVYPEPEPLKPEKLSKQLQDYINRERENLTGFTYVSIENIINFLEEMGE